MNLLVVFGVLMEERSVTRAGHRLGKTQSAISNSLKRLREQFDDPLFLRTSNGLSPTQRALDLGHAVVDILQIVETRLGRDQGIDPWDAKARLTLAAPDRLSLPIILPLIKTLSELAPNISIDVRTADRSLAIRLIEDQEVDVALGWFDRLPRPFSSLPIFSEGLVCLVRGGHPVFSRQSPIDLDEFLSLPHLVVTSGGSREAAFDMILARKGLRRLAQATLSNFSMVPALLAGSDMVGVFTKRTAEYFAQNYALQTHPLPFEIEPITDRMVWHRRFDTDSLHSWFRDRILDHCTP